MTNASARIHRYGIRQRDRYKIALPKDPDAAAAMALALEAEDPHRTLYQLAGRREYGLYSVWLGMSLAATRHDVSWLYVAVMQMFKESRNLKRRFERTCADRDAAEKECDRLRGELAKLGRRALWARGDASRTEDESSDAVMTFGRYRGVKVRDLDGDYLAWAVREMKHISPDLHAAMTSELSSRTNRAAR